MAFFPEDDLLELLFEVRQVVLKAVDPTVWLFIGVDELEGTMHLGDDASDLGFVLVFVGD